MTRGTFVEVAQEPGWDSVDEYRQHLKSESPIGFEWSDLFEPDIQCTCCSQKAPSEAAALLKVEDQTPFTKKFGITDVTPTGQQGEQVWICADCFHNGVRPKHVYFGNIRWNKMGRKVKNKAENSRGSVW